MVSASSARHEGEGHTKSSHQISQLLIFTRWTVTCYLPGSDLHCRGEEAAPQEESRGTTEQQRRATRPQVVTTGTEERTTRRMRRQIARGSRSRHFASFSSRNRVEEKLAPVHPAEQEEREETTNERDSLFFRSHPPTSRKKRRVGLCYAGGTGAGRILSDLSAVAFERE